MSDEKVFADGFFFKRHERAPDFVVGNLSLNLEKAAPFIKANRKGDWLNLQIKQARSGTYYVELDTFEPKGGRDGRDDDRVPAERTQARRPAKRAPEPEPEIEDDDLPF